jgi:hypothetical protein
MKAITEDEEFQKRGMIVCRYSLGAQSPGHLHLDYVIKAARLTKTMPTRTVGYHYCYDDAKLRPLLATLQMFGGRNLRLRFRAHFGKNIYDTIRYETKRGGACIALYCIGIVQYRT